MEGWSWKYAIGLVGRQIYKLQMLDEDKSKIVHFWRFLGIFYSFLPILNQLSLFFDVFLISGIAQKKTKIVQRATPSYISKSRNKIPANFHTPFVDK